MLMSNPGNEVLTILTSLDQEVWHIKDPFNNSQMTFIFSTAPGRRWLMAWTARNSVRLQQPGAYLVLKLVFKP